MYVLEILIAGYRDVIEQEYMLGQLVSWSGNVPAFIDGITQASSFFDHEVLYHMKLEEQVLYPILRRVVPPGQVETIRQFEIAHRMVERKLKDYSDAVRTRMKLTLEKDRQEILACYKNALQSVVAHARKESEVLPSLIKEYFKSENYNEAEYRYSQFIRK
jgi:hemerythrin-like domain-containing protein